jgi:hypothetical protein
MGNGGAQSEAFNRYPSGKPNDLDTGIRRYDDYILKN